MALSMPGKVNWAVRSSGGAGPFLTGVSAVVTEADAGTVELTKAAATGVGSAIMHAHMPHKFGKCSERGIVFLFDAAERGVGRFRMGIEGLKDTYRSFKCSKSASSSKGANASFGPPTSSVAASR